MAASVAAAPSDLPKRNLLRDWGPLAAVLAGALAYPLLDVTFRFGQLDRIAQMLLLVMLAVGLNTVVGSAGLLDLGYVAFFAIGSYTAAYLTSPVSPLPIQTDFWAALAVSWLTAAVFGVLLGAPTLRLRGDYLAIVTLAFGEIVPRVFLNAEGWTGGSRGMNPIARPIIGDLELGITPVFGSPVLPWYYLILFVLLLSLAATARLNRSRLGRAWAATREDPLAASSVGINPVTTRLAAFAVGASFSGFAGCLSAGMIQVVSPSQFDYSTSIMVLAMVILGGAGNLPGVVVGGLLIGFFDRVLASELTNWTHALGNFTGIPLLLWIDFSNLRMLVFGLALVLTMLARPQGIWPAGNRRRTVFAPPAIPTIVAAPSIQPPALAAEQAGRGERHA
ncbi:MAG: branched-chain amino acid ABC transporter permease [Chloroflexi bacterium]|nr:branched-chain amino acid ABC transporter permease [Chloroflexota bacterium]